MTGSSGEQAKIITPEEFMHFWRQKFDNQASESFPAWGIRAKYASPGEVFWQNMYWWGDEDTWADKVAEMQSRVPEGIKVRLDPNAAVDHNGRDLAAEYEDKDGRRPMAAAVYVSLARGEKQL